MPVYEQSYSHYAGAYRPRALSWSVIAMKGIGHLLKEKGFRILMFVSLFVFFILSIQLYLSANAELLKWMGIREELTDFLKVNERFYYNFLQSQQFFCFLLPLVFGADLIAQDRRTKALALYLSKPITRLDYLFGKGAIVLFYLYLITLVPGLFLMFLHAFFTEDWGYLSSNVSLMLRIALFSHILIIPILLSIMTLSSLVKSRISSGTMFCVLYFVPFAISNIFRQLFYDPLFSSLFSKEWWSLVSFQTIWSQLGAEIFHQEIPYEIHWGYHLAALLLFCVLASMLLYRQIRAVEIVK
ncbi:MAG: ABC transporter permease subunit [Candidatus Omnitrophota bacterium]